MLRVRRRAEGGNRNIHVARGVPRREPELGPNRTMRGSAGAGPRRLAAIRIPVARATAPAGIDGSQPEVTLARGREHQPVLLLGLDEAAFDELHHCGRPGQRLAPRDGAEAPYVLQRESQRGQPAGRHRMNDHTSRHATFDCREIRRTRSRTLPRSRVGTALTSTKGLRTLRHGGARPPHSAHLLCGSRPSAEMAGIPSHAINLRSTVGPLASSQPPSSFAASRP